jgi:UDP-N-acetylglucosamine 2-epimerase (non-hydrolysing)
LIRRKVVTVIGTRPEVIKMAPVIEELRARPAFEHVVLSTAQHRQMLDQITAVFGIEPDMDLGLMRDDQGLADFASRSLLALSGAFASLEPDAVLVQGDTTTVMTASLAAFYQGIPVGHVEAGLRSFDRRNPFPEEINRRVAGCVADFHFAPTDRARDNLLREGVAPERIAVTGNTIVDAARLTVGRHQGFTEPRLKDIDTDGDIVLVTVHRRENHGPALRSICRALRTLATRAPSVRIVLPLHLNPRVRSTVLEELEGTDRIHLVPPLPYQDLLQLMAMARLVLTDSGGIQEEAPFFRKPVLVLREVTERPEVLETGFGRLVGTDEERIVQEAARVLFDDTAYLDMTRGENPFGDGYAAGRIVDFLEAALGVERQQTDAPA